MVDRSELFKLLVWFMMEEKLESVSITAYKGQTVLWRANNFDVCQGQN